MNEAMTIIEDGIVPVYETDTGEKVVFGRELWQILGSKTDFSNWMKRRISECDAVENEDYSLLAKNGEQKSNSGKRGGWNKLDYIIKLDTAKEMAMLERNKKGKQVRRYFIAVEKRFKEMQEAALHENVSCEAEEWARYFGCTDNSQAQQRLNSMNAALDVAIELSKADRNWLLQSLYGIMKQHGVPLDSYVTVSRYKWNPGISTFRVIADNDELYQVAITELESLVSYCKRRIAESAPTIGISVNI